MLNSLVVSASLAQDMDAVGLVLRDYPRHSLLPMAMHTVRHVAGHPGECFGLLHCYREPYSEGGEVVQGWVAIVEQQEPYREAYLGDMGNHEDIVGNHWEADNKLAVGRDALED